MANFNHNPSVLSVMTAIVVGLAFVLLMVFMAQTETQLKGIEKRLELLERAK